MLLWMSFVHYNRRYTQCRIFFFVKTYFTTFFYVKLHNCLCCFSTTMKSKYSSSSTNKIRRKKCFNCIYYQAYIPINFFGLFYDARNFILWTKVCTASVLLLLGKMIIWKRYLKCYMWWYVVYGNQWKQLRHTYIWFIHVLYTE